MILHQKNYQSSDIRKLAKLHSKAFPTSELTSYGQKSLYYFLNTFNKSRNSQIHIVVNSEEDFDGYALTSDRSFGRIIFSDPYCFYYGMLFIIFGLLNNTCGTLRNIYETLYSSKSISKTYELPALHLLSICSVRAGAGSELIKYICEKVADDFSTIILTTDRYNNESVISFYVKNGFKQVDQISRTSGREMILMMKRIGG